MVRYTPADTSTPGVKEVVATCGSSSATCTVTVVGVELISCRDVVSATDNPGATETVYVAVGEDGKTETITAVPKPAGQWPAGWPMWDGADQCAGDAGSAVFPLIESLDAEGTVVRVTCGDSAAALRIVVFEVGVYNENTGAIKDGDVSLPFTCEVFPEGLDVSSYTWSATWPELAYNNPHVKFTDGSSSETRISPAWWYSTSGETCSDDIAVYDIYCTVVVGGTVASNRTPEKLCVDVGGEKKNDGSERVGGEYYSVGYSGTVHYSFAMTNGYYVVLNAIDPWNRIDAWFENYHPPTSQFYPKVQEHEQKHIDDLNDGFDGHVFINKQEFVPWIIGLTNSTLEGLDALVKEEFKRYLEEEVAEMNSLKSVLEDRAYGVSDAIVPFYVYQGECGGLK